MDQQSLIDTFIEVETLDADQFFKVRETLTRIGLSNRRSKTEKPILWQSCHILHKQGKYYIVHFKQLFLLDGKEKKTDLTQEDIDRTKLIAHLLDSWGLVKLITPLDFVKDSNVTIIPFEDKAKWDLRSKYTIGKAHSRTVR